MRIPDEMFECVAVTLGVLCTDEHDWLKLFAAEAGSGGGVVLHKLPVQLQQRNELVQHTPDAHIPRVISSLQNYIQPVTEPATREYGESNRESRPSKPCALI